MNVYETTRRVGLAVLIVLTVGIGATARVTTVGSAPTSPVEPRKLPAPTSIAPTPITGPTSAHNAPPAPEAVAGYYAPADAEPETPCQTALRVALEIGFPPSEAVNVRRMVYAESRCDPAAYNPTDRNGGSYGVAQINGVWCEPNVNWPIGYFQARGLIDTCADLFDLRTNLVAARHIWARSGWGPWTTMRGR